MSLKYVKLWKVPGRSYNVQGTELHAKKCLKREVQSAYIDYYKSKNGNWRFIIPMEVFCEFLDEKGRTHEFEFKNQIKDYYGRQRITDKCLNQFKSDLRSGIIKVLFDEDTEGYFIKTVI